MHEDGNISFRAIVKADHCMWPLVLLLNVFVRLLLHNVLTFCRRIHILKSTSVRWRWTVLMHMYPTLLSHSSDGQSFLIEISLFWSFLIKSVLTESEVCM